MIPNRLAPGLPDGKLLREILSGASKDSVKGVCRQVGTVKGEVGGQGPVHRRKGEEPQRMPSGEDSRVGMSFRAMRTAINGRSQIKKALSHAIRELPTQAETELWPREIMQASGSFNSG